MARNKYPEETREKILHTALRLFMEKGYENTTIQDIINELGGLTKGAIYHHFKSKEDIMITIIEELFSGSEPAMEEVMDNKELTGFEKLQKMILVSLLSADQEKVFSFAPDMKKSPDMLLRMLQDTFDEATPMVQKIAEEGIQDGSIHLEYPKEFTEVFLLLTNVWMNPLVIQSTPEEMIQKFLFLKEFTERLGLEGLLTKEMMDRLVHYQELYNKLN